MSNQTPVKNDKCLHSVSIIVIVCLPAVEYFTAYLSVTVLQIYTATNAKARELLTDRLVSEITMKRRIYFGPNKISNAYGLFHIIDDYRSAACYFHFAVIFVPFYCVSV